MSKTIALIAVALGVVAASAGSAFAAGGCGSYSGAQSVSLETQTASTGDTNAPITPVPESSSN